MKVDIVIFVLLYIVITATAARPRRKMPRSKVSEELRFLKPWPDSEVVTAESTLRLNCSAVGATEYRWTFKDGPIQRLYEKPVSSAK